MSVAVAMAGAVPMAMAVAITIVAVSSFSCGRVFEVPSDHYVYLCSETN